jgi:hypothetical protein
MSTQPSFPQNASSCQRNTLNLNRGPLRQLIYCNTAPRWLVRKPFLISTIHLREIVHARQEHIDFDDFADIASGCFQNGRQVLDAEVGHLANAGGREGENLAGRGARDLAGAVNCLRGSYCLGLWW